MRLGYTNESTPKPHRAGEAGETAQRRRRGCMSAETLQALISRSALEWRLTFDALEFPLLLLEMDGRIVRMNEAARVLAGATCEEAIHPLLEVLGNGQPWSVLRLLLSQVAATGERAGTQTREEH